MGNTDPKNNLPDDEFDIEVLAQKLYRINKKIWYKLAFPFRVLAANKKRLGIIMLAAIVAAVIGRYTIPAVYKTSFVIKPNNLAENAYLNMLNDLDILIADKNYPEIAHKLNMDETIATSLKSISVKVIYKNELKKDTTSLVEITLLLRDGSLIDTFQNSIVNTYLNQNAYYLKLQHLKEKDLDAMEERLVRDLKENDSLKKTVTANAYPRSSGGFVYGEPIDPLRIYESGLGLYQGLINIRMQRAFITSFELVKPGVVRIKPYFPRLIILLPVFLFIGACICFVMNKREISQ